MKIMFNRLVADGRGAYVRFMRDSPAATIIGALSLCVAFGAVSYYIDIQKAGKIPLAFSEHEKIFRKLKAQDQPVPALTKLYAPLNDVLMKVFEANNKALQHNTSHDRFATELDYKMDPSLKVHTQIGEIAAQIPADARAALGVLTHLIDARRDIQPVISSLDQSWDDSHVDVTKTRTWTESECTPDGKSCKTVVKSEQVYDYTIHTYTYDPNFGNIADQGMKSFVAQHPDLNTTEKLVLPTQTGADNEFAIEQSMPDVFDGKIPTPEQSLAIASRWATGSNYTSFQPIINQQLAGLKTVSPMWSASKNTAMSVRYITHRHSDSGPNEFQVAERALNNSRQLSEAIGKIVDGIQAAGYAVPQLKTMIDDYIGVVLDKKPGDADQLRSDIMSTAQSLYYQNFENGLDVRPFKWEHVAFIALLGAALGGLGGAGIDHVRNRRRGFTYG